MLDRRVRADDREMAAPRESDCSIGCGWDVVVVDGAKPIAGAHAETAGMT